MKKSLLLSVLACMAMPAFATGQHPSTPASTHSSANAASTSTAKANSDASSTSNASGGSIDYFNGGGRAYSLVSIPAFATPLPGGMCPKGDSESFSILWGLVTHAKSTTRTEMECLDKVLAAMRAQPMPLAPTLPPGPIYPPAAAKKPASAPPATVKPSKGAKTAGSTPSSGGCKHVTANGDVMRVNCVWL